MMNIYQIMNNNFSSEPRLWNERTPVSRCPAVFSQRRLIPMSPLFEHGIGPGIVAANLSARPGDAGSRFGGESVLGRVCF